MRSFTQPAADPAAPPSHPAAAVLVGPLLATWAVATLAVGAWFTGHPQGSALPAARYNSAEAAQIWHILGDDCGLSSSVLSSLLARGPAPGVRDKVLLLAEDPQAERLLTDRGFEVTRGAVDPLRKDFGVRGSPWLVVLNHTSRPLFSGLHP